MCAIYQQTARDLHSTTLCSETVSDCLIITPIILAAKVDSLV